MTIGPAAGFQNLATICPAVGHVQVTCRSDGFSGYGVVHLDTIARASASTDFTVEESVAGLLLQLILQLRSLFLPTSYKQLEEKIKKC